MLILYRPNEDPFVNDEELVSELLTTVFLLTYIMMTDVNDNNT